MTQATCELCDRPVDGTAYACPACTGKTRSDLDTIAAYADDAQDAADGLARYGPAGPGHHGEDRAPVNLSAAGFVARATNTVTTWARHVAETRGITVPAPAPVTGPTCAVDCRHRTCHAIRCRLARACGHVRPW